MKHTLFILALITASIQTFAQSPRIKLNQITKDSVTGSVLISSPTDSGMVYSRDLFISYGADTVLILGGDTLAATSGIISSVLSDGVTIIGNGTIGSELTADTSVLATLRALSDSLALVISSVTADGVTITGDGTVGSPLKVDTATVIATKQDLDLYYLDSNPDGYTSNTGTVTSVAATAGTGISVSGSPITTSGTLTITNTAPDQTVSIAGGGINAVTGTYPSFTVTGTEVDGSISNEGSLTVGAGTASTSVISSNTSGSTDVTLTAGTNVTLSETGNNITISATGGGTTYNNISETADTVYISDYLDVDTATLYVDASTNRVGIGTSTPTMLLNLYSQSIPNDTIGFDIYQTGGATDGAVKIISNNGGATFGIQNLNSNGFSGIEFLDYTGIARVFAGYRSSTNEFRFNNFASGGYIDFMISSSSKIHIANNGNVGIGTTNPSEVLEVNGNILASGTITPSGSDRKLKTNISTLNSGLDVISNLIPVTYDFIQNTDKKFPIYNQVGFVAQDVQDALSGKSYINGIVIETKDYLALDYDKFSPIIVKAIQEQQTIIESQATEIETLKTLITELSNRLTILENN